MYSFVGRTLIDVSRCCALVLLALAGAAVSLQGQTRGLDSLFLTSDEAVDRALSGNPELLRERVRIARARAELSRAPFFPERPELEAALSSDAPFRNEGEGEWELFVSQEFEIGGQYFLRRSVAEATVVQTEYEIKAVELALRADTRTAYARLVAAESRLRLLDTLRAFAGRLDTLAAQLLAAQEISELDRNLVRIERAQAEMERSTAASDLFAARVELGRLTGTGTGIVIAAPPESLRPPSRGTIDSIARIVAAVEADSALFLSQRPDWQALESARRRAGLERDLANRVWLPRVKLGVGVLSETTAETGPGDATVLSSDRFLGLTLGIGIPLPFSGLYDLGEADRAVADAEVLAIDAEQRIIRSRIRADIDGALGRLELALAAYTTYVREIEPLVARNIELLERGYAGGELSAVEVVTQQERLLRAADGLIEARLAYEIALADVERATAR